MTYVVANVAVLIVFGAKSGHRLHEAHVCTKRIEPGTAHDRRQADADGNHDYQESQRGHGTPACAPGRASSTLAMKASVSRKIDTSDRMKGANAATMM